MLKEIWLSAWNKKRSDIPKENCLFVARNKGNNELAPSEKLFQDFKKKEAEYHNVYGKSAAAYNKAFKDVNYEKRFRKEILNNQTALEELKQISHQSKKKDIYLVCYEGTKKACHRRILLRICQEQFDADIIINGIEP